MTNTAGIRAEQMDDLVRSAVDFLLASDKADEAEAVTVLVEIIADLRQPHEPRGWQPIETVPTDGRQVLMLYAPKRPANTLTRIVAQYNAMHGWSAMPGHFWLMADELRGWMPLPHYAPTKDEKL